MERIDIRTTKRVELVDITEKIRHVVSNSKVKDGICFIFVPHTTAGLTINENADPSVKKDIIDALNRLVPESSAYSHAEGNADSHIKSSLFGSNLHIFVKDNNLLLGTWQGIFFAESDGPRRRQLWIDVLKK